MIVRGLSMIEEEKLMYEVMKAIYDSGIPIEFKGSMVLKACLIEAGYSDEIRHTVDIDANWRFEASPTAEQMTDSLKKAFIAGNIDLDVRMYRMYGDGRSAGFELMDKTSGEVLFTMDIDVNRPVTPTKIYEAADFKFRGVAPVQMIADKVLVVSSDKVFRRIKDVIDIYYFSKVFDFDKDDVMKIISESERTLEDFNAFLYRKDELKHAYEKFRFNGNVDKPSFDEVYNNVKVYIKDILPI